MSVPVVKSNSSTESIRLVPEISKIPDLLAKALDPALVFVRLNFSCSRADEKNWHKSSWGFAFKFQAVNFRVSATLFNYMCS